MNLQITHIASLNTTRPTGPSISVGQLNQELHKIPNLSSRIVDPLDATTDLNFEERGVYVFHGVWNTRYWSLARRLRRNDIPYIVTPRASLVKKALWRSVTKKTAGLVLGGFSFIRNAHALHFLTEEEARNSIKFSSDYLVVPNGVRFYPPETSIDGSLNERDDLQGVSNTNYLLFLGRLDIHHKGLDLLVRAAHRARSTLAGSKTRIIIAGDDFRGESPKLEKMIRGRKLRHLVKIVPRSITGDEKLQLINGSLGFIHTSRYEGEPQAVLEALSLRTPVLVTRGTNMTRFVSENNLGVTTPTSERAIANGLEHLLMLTSQGHFSQHARWCVMKERTWKNIALQTAKEYRRLLDKYITDPSASQCE